MIRLLSYIFLILIGVIVFPSSLGAMNDLAGMPLRGEGVKKMLWKRVLKVGLYAPRTVTSESILEAHPKCIRAEYYVSISGDDLGGYIRRKMMDNAGNVAPGLFQPGLERLERILPDIEPGDSLTMCYDPSLGTTFSHNAQVQGVIAGDGFAGVLFATWLGDHPVDDRLKCRLLGEKRVCDF